jgi:chromosome partitioning protein
MGVSITISNHKGGVGKTCTAVNLGHALARENKKVLVVDFDLQLNCTRNLYGKDRPIHSLTELLDPREAPITDIKNFVYPTEHQNLFVVPNTKQSAAIERLLFLDPERLKTFRLRFRDYINNRFDYALFDTPPNYGGFTMSAMLASDCVIVPCETGSKDSMEGVNEAVKFIESIRDDFNLDVIFLKVLLTKRDRRVLIHKATVEQIKDNYPSEKRFETIIPANTHLQQAEMFGTTVFRLRSNATGAIAYEQAAKELIETIEG